MMTSNSLVTDTVKLEKLRSSVLEQLSLLMQIHTQLHNFRGIVSELTNDFLTEVSSGKINVLQDRNARLLSTLQLLHLEEEKLIDEGGVKTQYVIQNFNDVTKSLENAIRQLEYHSTRDPLTNLYNRRSFDELLNDEVSRSTRYHHEFSFIFIDIDDFKSINDSYGHAVGDAVLVQITNIFHKNSRKQDVVGRFAGDEFSIILPETNVDSAINFAEKIRKMVQDTQFDTMQGSHFQCTISIGITTFPHGAKNSLSLLRNADNALYRAKKTGKNSVST
ncbi:MAG: GGDEF domain-containing protein [Legionellaceae bacterium]|nr:GGDEF domain-containing protein [Legionellaceae bacterium]